MKLSPFSFWCFLGLVGLSVVPLVAQTSDQREFFESKIRPILAQECYECHSEAKKQKGGLLLDSRVGWQAGGESGPVIVPGSPEKSLLIRSLHHEVAELEMPKNGAKLEPRVLADFEKWIREGAFDPRDRAPSPEDVAKETDWKVILERRKQWWAFQPLPEAKKGVSVAEMAAAINARIRQKWQEKGLQGSAKANEEVLVRRLSYVITGLPPSAGLAEKQKGLLQSDAAYAEAVDTLLNSLGYGEKWARHFMDWVRYAESYGSEGDPAIPYAWRYRDYLIRAFQQDVRWPQMVREAIAGDLLEQPRVSAGVNESAMGISQLRMVLHGFSPVDSLDEMVTFTDNQIDTVTKAFQALTVSCARCHHHKFDAISQDDFYALYGIFTSTHPAVIDANVQVAGEEVRARLKLLKQEIRKTLAEEWLAGLPAKEKGEKAEASLKTGAENRSQITFSWQGLTPSAAGEFSISGEGKKLIERIYPSGFVSDSISDRERVMLFSQRFKNPGGKLWMRVAGEGGVKAKYVVQNYPRTGTIHKAIELKTDKERGLAWRSLDLDFWKGDEIYLQISTVADMPVETQQKPSWFMLNGVSIQPGDFAPSEPERCLDSTEVLIQAWARQDMSDAQAEELQRRLESGVLANQGLSKTEKLVQQYRRLVKELPEPMRVPGVVEADAKNAVLFVRGDHKQPSYEVPRRFLEVFDPTPFQTAGSGRRELAEKMADLGKNPLTARVIVNRVWHHVFGRGIVASTDNFGKLGDLPTHPELLDEVAAWFVKQGGSVQELIRLLVSTEAFQLDSQLTESAVKADPENAFLTHWKTRRLEAEAIRDSLVTLSGKLDATLYGESVPSSAPRRSVYVKVIRNALDPFLTTFDAPVPFSTRGQRDSTNVPAQSLTLLNDPNVIRWSQDWAERLLSEPRLKSGEQRVHQMYQEAFGRDVSETERKACLRYVEKMLQSAKVEEVERQKLENQVSDLGRKVSALLDPVREKLVRGGGGEKTPQKPPKDLPEPLAEWTFEHGGADERGRLPLELVGGAKIEKGCLMLDGQAMARTGSLPKKLKAKTLEAWVMLDDLVQQGGGVVTVQGKDGVLFDSLVFGEKQAGRWVAGSNFFERSEFFEGVEEREATRRVVHVAVVTEADGTVRGYRDGVPYGRSYRKAPAAVFEAEQSQVLLGCRHGQPTGNHGLKGRIFRARLYDRALKPEEIELTAEIENSTVTLAKILSALSAEERSLLAKFESEKVELTQRLAAKAGESATKDPSKFAWSSLAQSLMNLKEFLYLR